MGPRYNIYALREGRRSTRHNAQYDWIGIRDGVNPGTYYASVSMVALPGRYCIQGLHNLVYTQSPQPFVIPWSRMAIPVCGKT
jgi:hypothetical protein